MNQVWETHRGDEWWYKDYWCEASASRAANIVSISCDKIVQGQLNEERLHEFLWRARCKFDSEKIMFSISKAEVRDLLSTLSQRGIVEFVESTSSFSKDATITKVKEYKKPQSPVVASKKKWWQLW